MVSKIHVPQVIIYCENGIKKSCPKGHYCKDGIKNSCPSGQFQPNEGSDECIDCTSNCGNGKYRTGSCTSTKDYSCNNCEYGYYCDGVKSQRCSDCGDNQYMTGGCTGNEDTKCGTCSYYTTQNKRAHQEGIDWGSGCNGNCKVELWDDTLKGNHWDLYGKADNGWWLRGTKGSGEVYWETNYSDWQNPPQIEGNKLEFWQYTTGNNKWKFNIIKDQQKYKKGNNKQTYCDICSGHNRSMGGWCINALNNWSDYISYRLGKDL